MEKNRFDTVNFDTCPELVLFALMEDLNSKLYSYILEKDKKISKKDPVVIDLSQKNLEICRHLTRFGVDKPIEIKGKHEILTKEAIAWFTKWSNYLHHKLEHHLIYEYYDDLDEWYKNNNYNLSRWQPK